MRTMTLALVLSLCLLACTPPAAQVPAPVTQMVDTDETMQELTNTDWLLTRVDGEALDSELLAAISDRLIMRIDQQHIDDAAAKLSGFDGCNRFFASVELELGQLKVGPVGASKMYCVASSEFAQGYHQRLRQVRSYAVSDRQMHLYDDAGAVLLTYRLP